MEAKTLRCFAGLCESAVSVRFGENLIAFLHTGQVLLQQPTQRQFNRIAATLLKWGIEVDMQLADYLGRVRVEKAKNLLQNPNLRVSTIALEVGFQSVSQFNRTFRKVTGRSPKQLRPRKSAPHPLT